MRCLWSRRPCGMGGWRWGHRRGWGTKRSSGRPAACKSARQRQPGSWREFSSQQAPHTAQPSPSLAVAVAWHTIHTKHLGKQQCAQPASPQPAAKRLRVLPAAAPTPVPEPQIARALSPCPGRSQSYLWHLALGRSPELGTERQPAVKASRGLDRSQACAGHDEPARVLCRLVGP